MEKRLFKKKNSTLSTGSRLRRGSNVVYRYPLCQGSAGAKWKHFSRRLAPALCSFSGFSQSKNYPWASADESDLFDQPRSQGLFPPRPQARERALTTRLILDSNLTFDSVIRPLKSCSLLDHEILSNQNGKLMPRAGRRSWVRNKQTNSYICLLDVFVRKSDLLQGLQV